MVQSIRNGLAMFFMTLAILFCRMDDSRADAPLGQYVISNGTVFDTKSQLTWELAPVDAYYTQDGAISHCQNLQLDGPGWRAPSMKELQSIIDETRIEPSIDVTVFPGTRLEPYWTSSRRVANTSEGWLISFDYGGATREPVNVGYPVRCVR